MEEVEIKDEPAGEDCENVAIQWCLKWADMENLWLAVISQIAGIRNQL